VLVGQRLIHQLLVNIELTTRLVVILLLLSAGFRDGTFSVTFAGAPNATQCRNAPTYGAGSRPGMAYEATRAVIAIGEGTFAGQKYDGKDRSYLRSRGIRQSHHGPRAPGGLWLIFCKPA